MSGAIVRETYAVGGAALSALQAGPADGDVIVLLHGIPASAELWRETMSPLADAGWRVVAFDLPGYGHTLVPAGADHSLAGAAELVATWARIQVGRIWLVGHDLGGGVAQILASRHPTLLTRLTLADTVAETSWPVRPIRVLRALARSGLYPWLAATPLVPGPYARQQLRAGFADPSRLTREHEQRIFWDGKVTDDDGRRAFARHLVALDPGQTAAVAGNLTRLAVPTQVLWGRHDTFLPFDADGRRVEALLGAPDVHVLDDAGHYGPVEAPEAFARALLDWDPREEP